jgi:hypothetical protein
MALMIMCEFRVNFLLIVGDAAGCRCRKVLEGVGCSAIEMCLTRSGENGRRE